MRIGVLVPTQHPLEVNLQAVELAEQIGADAVWCPDHFLGMFHPDLYSKHAWSELVPDADAWFDPFCLNALLSQRTELDLGVAVTDGIRRSAIDVARSALTLHHFSKGGFHIGVGSGEAENLVPYGYPFDKPVGRFESFLRELRQYLDNGVGPHAPYARLGLPLETDAGRPLIWVAAHGPRMLRLCGQYGDGWLPAWQMSPQEYGDRRATIAGHADRAERPLPTCGMLAACILGESQQQLDELYESDPAAKFLTIWLSGERWREVGLEHPAGPESQGLVDVIVHEMDGDLLEQRTSQVPMELVRQENFMGTTDSLLETFAEYRDHGLEYILLTNATGMAGGIPEAEKRMPDFLRLAEGLRKL